MPECQHCHKNFSNTLKIDGRWRNLCNRRYCLDCSPFGKHNTRKIHLPKQSKTRFCEICRNYYKSGRGASLNTCGACRVTQSRKRLKEWLVNECGGKCKICGYSKCIAALEFHHIDPTKKERMIAQYSRRKEKVLEEAKKCILVCNRCHREIHSGYVTL
jgi:hypothetical protein